MRKRSFTNYTKTWPFMSYSKKKTLTHYSEKKTCSPLSLFNQGFKILAKLIAESIKLVLPYLSDKDQTGFLKRRYTGQTIVTIFDIIHHTDVENILAVMISIDIEKAFDKIDWNFMFKYLEFFKFPPYTKDWVKILYTDIKSAVTNNGWHTEYFNYGRGVRQWFL